MIKYILTALMLASAPQAISATMPEKPGQGFNCSFQTGLNSLAKVTLWYGQMGKTNVKTPQFTDDNKLFVRGGMATGNRMTFWVSDEWPEKFTVNYFDPADGSDFPSALLTVFSRSNDDKLHLAEVSHIGPKASAEDGKIAASKIYRGFCETSLDVTLSAFKNGVSQ